MSIVEKGHYQHKDGKGGGGTDIAMGKVRAVQLGVGRNCWKRQRCSNISVRSASVHSRANTRQQ